MQTLGRKDFADIELFRRDRLFMGVLNSNRVVSEGTLRQRLEDIAEMNDSQTLLDDPNVELLSKVGCFGEEKTDHASYIPIDVDVSVQDRNLTMRRLISATAPKK